MPPIHRILLELLNWVVQFISNVLKNLKQETNHPIDLNSFYGVNSIRK